MSGVVWGTPTEWFYPVQLEQKPDADHTTDRRPQRLFPRESAVFRGEAVVRWGLCSPRVPKARDRGHLHRGWEELPGPGDLSVDARPNQMTGELLLFRAMILGRNSGSYEAPDGSSSPVYLSFTN